MKLVDLSSLLMFGAKMRSFSPKIENEQLEAGDSLSHWAKDDSIALLYIGSVLPDYPEFHTPTFSRAGTMFQSNLLLGLKHAGLQPSKILSYRHVQTYPASRQLWIGRTETSLPEHMTVSLLPFFNITPIKQIMLGFFSLFHILFWGWQARHKPYKTVYTFNLTVPPGIFTLLGARLIGAKAVVSLNDINKPGHTVPDTIFNRIDFWLQRKLIPLFDGHIAVADSIMQDFAPHRRYVRLEGGITSETLHQLDKTGSRKRNNGMFTIVSAGTLDEANGFRVLIDAFSMLKGDRYRLCIAGGGPLAAEMRTAAAQDSRIEFLGMLPYAEVLLLYKSADLLINMRLTRALNTKYFFPSKLMEYLASGTPVLSTSTGHVEEEFGKYLYLLREETPSGLAKAIDHVASLVPEVRMLKADSAKEYMSRNKTWDTQGRRVAEYIRNLFITERCN